MGHFLSLSAIVGHEDDAVASELHRFATLHGGDMIRKDRSPERAQTLVLHSTGPRTTALYPHTWVGWDQASQHLSENLDTPVFSFHIHDGDLWMYKLYSGGTTIDQFNPIPDYFRDLRDNDPEVLKWQGNPQLVAEAASMSPASIARYLIRWEEELFASDVPRKAYDDDEFHIGDDWQMIDFMRRLGFQFPLDEDGNALGHTYHFYCRT